MILAALLACVFAPSPWTSVEARGSRCEGDDDEVSCEHETIVFAKGFTAREVHFALPSGRAPAEGWPVVFVFQGSLSSAENMWHGSADDAFGGLHQAELVRALLEGGHAVITPETKYDGATWWDTNVPPGSWAWETTEDHALMVGLLAAVDDGTFGPLDGDALFATGISSGGYMTSRVGVTYGRFRALAIQSASYATCGGPVCDVPADLPDDHPPTLFLHGEEDTIVPIETMARYAETLDTAGVSTAREIDADAGHEWLATAPEAIPAWFAEWE